MAVNSPAMPEDEGCLPNEIHLPHAPPQQIVEHKHTSNQQSSRCHVSSKDILRRADIVASISLFHTEDSEEVARGDDDTPSCGQVTSDSPKLIKPSDSGWRIT